MEDKKTVELARVYMLVELVGRQFFVCLLVVDRESHQPSLHKLAGCQAEEAAKRPRDCTSTS